MSPRIAYWTSSFEPEMEAIASEVACLRRANPGSVAWGISPRHWGQLSWRRGIGVHPKLHMAFRGATWFLQRAFHVNHLFGGLGDWYHLKAVAKRPTVLTVVVPGQMCDLNLLSKVDRFVVEWPAASDELVKLGVERHQVRLILPPADLARFRPIGIDMDRFTVLFASSPEREDWLQARGVPLLLAAAAKRPEWRFRFIWRPWGDALHRVQRWIEQRQLDNVDLVVGKFDDMASHYQQAHVTVTAFTDMDRCKSAPNSLVESLACGCPVVVTQEVGLASIIQEAKAGEICRTDSDGLVESLETVWGDWNVYSKRARRLAEQRFCAERFVREYDNVYQELIA